VARRQLAGKRILLTGASSGIGWALAIELARRGARLLLTARREERLRQLVEEIDRSNAEVVPEILAGDITEPGVQRELAHAAEVQLGGLDGLINCAGVGAVGRFDAATPDRLREIFEVNFFSAVELTRVALPLLKLGNQPIIVNIGSVLGHRAVPLKSEYCASKFAMHGWSDALRAELVADGIDVLLVSPSTTDSEFFNNLIEDRTVMNHKGARPMSPERVAVATAVAMSRGKHEIILSLGGKSLVWLDRLLPTLSDWLMARFANGKK
jgi:short-subunit dehydrogenase